MALALPGRDSHRQHQIVLRALAPRCQWFIGQRRLLHLEVQQLLDQCRRLGQGLGHLEPAGLKQNLQRADQLLFGHQPGAAFIDVGLMASGQHQGTDAGPEAQPADQFQASRYESIGNTIVQLLRIYSSDLIAAFEGKRKADDDPTK